MSDNFARQHSPTVSQRASSVPNPKSIDDFHKLKNPTGKHKDWYTPQFLTILCDVLNTKKSHIDSKRVVAAFKKEYKNLELKQRLNLIAELLQESLPGTYPKQLGALKTALGPKLEEETGMFTTGFFLYPLSQFVELFGDADPQASLDFIYELTQRFTGEWAVRTVANADKALTLKTMKAWAKDDNFHVRRLAAEGLRPRLPWGKKISWLEEKPTSVRPIYDRLRNDSVLYVRRSVANTLGDWIKIDEAFALETIERWLSKKHTPETLWVINHAIRTPVKKGNRKYIKLRERITKLRKDS